LSQNQKKENETISFVIDLTIHHYKIMHHNNSDTINNCIVLIEI